MATRKKTKKKSSRSKKSHGKSPAKQSAAKRRSPKKLAKRKATSKLAAGKKKKLAKGSTQGAASGITTKRRNEGQQPGSSEFSRESSGAQSGDLQGLSTVESVASESVDELMEEGNAFEAGVVSGVEDSRERDGKEVRTREVPEDDVPGEYREEE
jgi:hypothetical protein